MHPRAHWQARRLLRTERSAYRARGKRLGLICVVRTIHLPTPISSRVTREGGGWFPAPESLVEYSGGLQHSAGVSLALSELCQEDHFGGGRIPLSAILDLSKPSSQTSVGASCSDHRGDILNVVRRHQSAFVPLGPHVEKDVPKRLVQLVRPSLVPVGFYFSPSPKGLLTRVPTCSHFIGQRGRCLF